ncbi:MAG TPA: GNAT family N-acetyltransferase [Burkholderiaceae bacterium]|nr:GNAT family N-acetyltransferase [Burkholderiaceae bacterium]HQR71540.1 GNAT family N-acetyltransferase [Burkholderiaceae bacterium]
MDAIVLRGPRVLLRGWQPVDSGPFAALNADPVAMEFFPAPLSPAESDAMITRLQGGLETRGWGLWCLDIDGDCAGFVGLARPAFDAPFTPCVEVGWRMATRYWGHGYATEAARLALEFGFRQLGLTEIVSFTTAGNWRSRRVMERLGMRRDPADDFDHPRIAVGHPLRPHVLYRIKSTQLP